MKNIIGLLLLLSPVFLFSQTVGELRYDTLKILKKGGSSELVLMNKTRDSLGVLTNIGGGKTRFIKSKIIGDSLIVIGVDTLKLSPGQSVAGSDKQVQFNDGGALGAEAGFEYDKEENKFKADTLESSRVNVYTGTNKVILDNGSINISNVLEDGADDDVINVNTDYNSFKRYSITNFSNGSGAGAGGLYLNDIGGYLQFYVGSSANAFVPNGVLFRSSGNGGVNIISDSGPIAFGKSQTMGHSSEFGRFTTEGRLGIRTQTPQQALHIKGKIKIDTIPDDPSPDSLVTVVNGVLNKMGINDLPGDGGSPAGSDKQVQFNDGGSFGAEAGFEYDKSDKAMTVGSVFINDSLTVSPTWNGSGDYTAIGVNVTNTASGTGATLLRLMNGGVTKFEVAPTGRADIRTVSGENVFMNMYHNGSIQFIFGTNGNFGVGTVPTAKLHLRSGTASASSAPLKFNAGVQQQTALENGAVNYDGNNIFMTTNGINHKIAFADSMPVSGSYTPTATVVSNLEYAIPGYFTYTKVDSIITVYGRVGYEPTTASAATFRITLPLSSYSLPTSVVGFGGSYGGYFCRVVGYATDAQEVEVTVLNGEMSMANDLYFSFQYKIDYP